MSDGFSCPTTTNNPLSEHIDTLNVSISPQIKCDWKNEKLGSLIEYKKGFAFKSNSYADSGDVLIVRVSDTTDSSINIDSCMKIRSEEALLLDEYKLQTDDLIIATVGSWADNPKSIVGKVIKVPLNANGALLNQNAVRLRANEITTQKFLYYKLKDIDFSNYLLNNAQGSANQASITLKDIFSYDIKLPSLPEQKAIAAVLSSLDDKIDLLHLQNKTLEAMAETLFRQWFIEEAKEDWEEKPLGDVALVQNGYAFSSKDYVEFEKDFLEVFKMGHIAPGGGLRFSPKTDFVPRIEKLNRWILNKNDIVMAMTDMKDNMGILGHPAMIDSSNKYVLNQRVARIYIEKSSGLVSIYLLYLQLSTDEAISLLQSKANSGVQVNLSTDAIKSLPIIVPPQDVQYKVTENIEPIFNKIECNRIQIKTLEKLRDNLLPKLMSGEVRVQYEI